MARPPYYSISSNNMQAAPLAPQPGFQSPDYAYQQQQQLGRAAPSLGKSAASEDPLG